MGQIEVADIVRATSVTTERCFLGIDLGILCPEETENLAPGTNCSCELLEGLIMERIERFKADRRIGLSTVLLGLLGDDRLGELGGLNRGKLGDEPASGLPRSEPRRAPEATRSRRAR